MVMVALALWTDWDLFWDVSVNLVLVLLAWGVSVYLIRRTAGGLQVRGLTYGPAIAAFFLFSLGNAPNFLWGWQMSVFMNVLGVLFGIVVLSSARLSFLKLICGIAAGIVATYSHCTGFVFWPIAILLVLSHGSVPLLKKLKFVVCILLASIPLAYHYYMSVYQPGLEAGAITHSQERDLWDFVQFCLLYLGTPAARFGEVQINPLQGVDSFVFPHLTCALGLLATTGVVFLAVFLRLRYRVSWRLVLPYLALAAYAVGCSILAAPGRTGHGTFNGGIPRYMTFSNLLWMSFVLLMLVASCHLGRTPKRTLRAAVILLMGLILATSLHVGNRSAAHANRHNADGKAIRQAYPNIPDDTMLRVFPTRSRLQRNLDFMHDQRLNIFRDAGEAP